MPRSYLPFYPPVAVNALTAAAKDNRVLAAREGELQKIRPCDGAVSLARRMVAAKGGTRFELCRSIGTAWGAASPDTNDVCLPSS